MFDYKGIEALHAVHQLQSFEAAAKKLFLTQSAVSQRIKALENFYGEPVLVRTLPYRLTKLGTYLIGHFKKIALLESDFLEQLRGGTNVQRHVSIALNRDSLETWFIEVVREAEIFSEVSVEIIADDQELTLDYLMTGQVLACLSPAEKARAHAQVARLGTMDYALVAAPKIKQSFFSKSPRRALSAVRGIKFDHNDVIHDRYVEKFFRMSGADISYHYVPSLQAFKQFALLGLGYGLIPVLDIVQELRDGSLVNLFPTKIWSVPLYWHYWSIPSEFCQRFNEAMILHGRKKLSRR